MCGVIEHALELCPAIDALLSQPKYAKGPTKLDADEWDL